MNVPRQINSTSRQPQATGPLSPVKGSESGTPLTINPPFPVTYQVTETDASPGFVVATIPVGSTPIGIAFNPDNGDMYVANAGSNNVSVIAPLTTTFSEGCNGTIDSAGQTATCTVTNAYGRPA